MVLVRSAPLPVRNPAPWQRDRSASQVGSMATTTRTQINDSHRTTDQPRTAVRDAILAGLSPGLDRPTVAGVEWAAVRDTNAAVAREGTQPPAFDRYMAPSRATVEVRQ